LIPERIKISYNEENMLTFSQLWKGHKSQVVELSIKNIDFGAIFIGLVIAFHYKRRTMLKRKEKLEVLTIVVPIRYERKLNNFKVVRDMTA